MRLPAQLHARFEARRAIERQRWHLLADFMQATAADATALELKALDANLTALTEAATQVRTLMMDEIAGPGRRPGTTRYNDVP